MPTFPDPGYDDTPANLDPAYYQVLAEGIIAANSEIGWIFWNYGTYPFPGIYPAPRTLKTFHVIPVSPGPLVSITSVEIDVPPDAPDKLRYTVWLSNSTPIDGGYRLIAACFGITVDGNTQHAADD